MAIPTLDKFAATRGLDSNHNTNVISDSTIEDALVEQIIPVLTQLNPQLGDLANYYLNHPHPALQHGVREMIRSQGENSIVTTTLLLRCMLKDVPPEIATTVLEAAGTVFKHHVFEVVTDSLDGGREITPEQLEILNCFNPLAQQISLGHINIADIPADIWYQYPICHLPLGKLVLAKIQGKFDLSAEHTAALDSVTLGQMLHASLIAIQHLRDLTLAGQPSALDEFILECLAGRYAAVSAQMGSQSGYSRMTFDEAIDSREDAILIKVTMGTVVKSLQQNPEIDQFVENNIEDVKTALRLAARLIGIWNDIGSTVARSTPDQIAQLLNQLNAFYSGFNLRDALAPQALKDMAAGLNTSQLLQARKDLHPELVMDWDILNQIMKDSVRSEHSLPLDLGEEVETLAQDWHQRLAILNSLAGLSQLHEKQLGALLVNMPLAVQTVIRNAVLFHAHLYRGGDYYGASPAEKIPLLKGEYLPQDAYLMPNISGEV
jgi:hypothetical protein